MNAPPALDWIEANQRELSAELERIRGLLEYHAAHVADAAASADTMPLSSPESSGTSRTTSVLDYLCTRFGLSSFERDVLLLCAGVELEARFASLCATAQGDARRSYPTFSLALAALPQAHWSALAPQAPLRHWRLLELTEGPTLVTSRLAIDERILHFLVGVGTLDARLAGLVRTVVPAGNLPQSQQEQAVRLQALWLDAAGALPVVHVVGDDPSGARAVAAHACAELSLEALALRAEELPPSIPDRTLMARLLARECALRSGAVLLEGGEGYSQVQLAAFVEELDCPLIVIGGALPTTTRRSAVLEVRKPLAVEQHAFWRAVLSGKGEIGDATLDRLSAHFNLSTADITDAAHDAGCAIGQGEPPAQALWQACRLRARGALEVLAQRIDARADWDDLILPGPQLALLRDIVRQVCHRATVYERWGFAAKSARGLGISALFAGESGTGKTLAAEVLARDLGLDLYRIDLSAVVSKYIGETEKNLKRVFDAAETCGAVLLFDEADALFGKRSEVKDSHDRYANIELAYLLQRMEAYRGLAILTTNMKMLLDSAFLRRIRFLVHFPFPDVRQREAIWRRVFPAAMPCNGIRIEQLARLAIAGGSIRNIAVNAAFLAADEGAPLSMPHLLRAARVECAKLEKPLTEAETGGWQ